MSVTKTQLQTAKKLENSPAFAKAQELIEAGAYKEATVALGSLWKGIGVRPDVTLYAKAEQAEILLTVGTLSGWLGSLRQIESAQERAKDLLSESSSLFAELADKDRWAQARCELGVCYWRTGAVEDARIVFDDALDHAPEISARTQWNLTHGLVTVELLTHNYRYAERLLRQAEHLIDALDNDVLRGDLYFHQAIAQKRIAEEESLTNFHTLALGNYEKARMYYERAGHASLCASVANNVGYVLCDLNRFDEAHRQLDAALSYYQSAAEKSRAASTNDTKARVYLAENKLEAAEKAALASVRLLREGDDHALLAESLTTLGTIYARKGEALRSRRAFESAHTVAEGAGNKSGAAMALLTWLEELATELPNPEFQEMYQRVDAELSDSPRVTVQKRLKKLAQRTGAGEPDIVINLTTAPRRMLPDQDDTLARADWEGFSLPQAVREFEAQYILRAIRDSNNSITHAADLLGLSHQNLSLQLRQRHTGLIPLRRSRGKTYLTPQLDTSAGSE